MGEKVTNEELASGNGDMPVKGYDSKHGKYSESKPPVEDTAVNASKLVEPKTPWKSLKSGS